jgi:hypothetical protein
VRALLEQSSFEDFFMDSDPFQEVSPLATVFEKLYKDHMGSALLSIDLLT